MISETALTPFHNLDYYRQHFMDPTIWEPFVRDVCRRHDLSCRAVRAGLAGTCPTFIVDDRWVIKFFGELFDGGEAFRSERFANQLAARLESFPAPAVVGDGQLLAKAEHWPWPYLIFNFIDGISIGEVFEQVSQSNKLATARQLGPHIRQLHELPIPHNSILPPTWDTYRAFLQTQRSQCRAFHQAEQTLPQHLIDQIDDFLLPVDDLIDLTRPPHLIHADLTADHLLGRLENGQWTPLGLIDFGDAMIGNLYYELIALSLDMFRCEKPLLRAFLETYGLDESARRRFPQKAMTTLLLHRFNVPYSIAAHYPEALKAPTLDDLAMLLWDLTPES